MDAERSRRLFETNAGTYDRVNTVISLGLDARWRRWVARQAAERPGARVLDAFAGTGRVGLETAALGADVTLADASPGMLDVAVAEAKARGLTVRSALVDLTTGDLPFVPGSFDAVTVSFGVRYLDRPTEVLRDLGRLLAPGGRLVVLEFTRPGRGLVSSAAGFYFFRVLPRLAGAVAGRRELYDYLTSSTMAVGHADDLVRIVQSAGFDVQSRRTFGFGLVTGLVARPPLDCRNARTCISSGGRTTQEDHG